ncbi:uncharacterized protein [Antedon mediterranea]|uniref:uncharacterized protein n=1 Tax=Antedon mediterranea TaxID=105859 RepID=UPI003AF9D90D
MCDSLIKEGVLHYKKHGGRVQKWIKRYAQLYEQSAEGQSRLELYEAKEGQRKGGQKPQHTISLKACIKISQAVAQKSQKFVIELVFDEKIHLLAVDTQVDLELWIGDLRRIAFNEVGESFGCTKQQQSPQTSHKKSPSSSISRNSADAGMLDNSLYSSYGVDEVFHVTIRPDEFSERLKLKGDYNLVLGIQRLAIHDKLTNAPLHVWPYKFLRRYGRDRGSFSMEGGRRCEPGPGKIIFDTLQGNEIFQKVQYYVKDMSTSTLNRGSMGNIPGLEESQPPLPARGYLEPANQEPPDIYINENRDMLPVERQRVTSLETHTDKKTYQDWKKNPTASTNQSFIKHLDRTLQHTTATRDGQAHAGQAHVGQAHVGQPHVGQAHVGQAHVGKAHIGQAHVGQAHVGQAHVGQAHVGQAHVGQAHVGQAHVQRSNSVDPVYTVVPESNNGWKGNASQIPKDYSIRNEATEAYSELDIQTTGPEPAEALNKKEAARRKKELKKAELDRKKLEKEREKEREKEEKEREKAKKEREKEEKNRRRLDNKRLKNKPSIDIQNELQYENPNTGMPITQPEESLYEDANSMSKPETPDANVYDRLQRQTAITSNIGANRAQPPASDQTYDNLQRNMSKRTVPVQVKHQFDDSTYDRLDPCPTEISSIGESEYNTLTLPNHSEAAIPVCMDESGYIEAEHNYRFKRDDDNVGQDQVGLYADPQ